jgi:hypothetical protein
MTALLTYVKDSETDQTYMAVVADDTGAQYIWAPGVTPFWEDDAARLARLIDGKPTQPASAKDWLSVATYNVNNTYSTDVERAPSVEAGVNAARKAFDDMAEPEIDEDGDPILGETTADNETRWLGEAARAFDEITEDYPEFGELDDDEEAQATTNFVLSMLGPIDPEGPNGWILREIDGNPRPGDEKMYLTFSSESVTEEA